MSTGFDFLFLIKAKFAGCISHGLILMVVLNVLLNLNFNIHTFNSTLDAILLQCTWSVNLCC